MKHFALLAIAVLGTCWSAVAQSRDSAGESIVRARSFSGALMRSAWKRIEQIESDGLVITKADRSITSKSDDVRIPPPKAASNENLVGTWQLVSAGTFRKDGTFEPYPEYGPNPKGYLMYDKTGHMCVSLANPNHPHWADPEKPTDAEKLRSYDAFFAYCGTYEVRQQEGRVIHRPEVGSWPHYIGTDQNRNFRLEGDRLILSDEETPPGGEQRKYQITWRRVESQDH
jgi:Lipocalin-like domain